MKSKVFFSYSFKNHLIIEDYYSLLSKYASNDLEIFFYDRIYHEGSWDDAVKEAIENTDIFIFFLGLEIGKTQQEELDYWKNLTGKRNISSIKVIIKDLSTSNIEVLYNFDKVVDFRRRNGKFDIFRSFQSIYRQILNKETKLPDGLPSNIQLFNYEKDIIDFYRDKYIIGKKLNEIKSSADSFSETEKLKDIEEKLKQGVAPEWPKVKINLRIEINENGQSLYKRITNPILSEIGAPRKAHVLAAALTSYHEIEYCHRNENPTQENFNFCMKDLALSFPEAGPREKIYMPTNIPDGPHHKVAILVSGGIAPGINAVIDELLKDILNTLLHLDIWIDCRY